MKLTDTRETYQFATGKVSDVSRQLALAALGIVWIFKTDRPGVGIGVPPQLASAALLAIVALALDLLQYTYMSVAWGIFNRIQEKRVNLDEEADFHAPKSINWPSNVFFYLKLAAVVACYAGLLRYLLHAVAH